MEQETPIRPIEFRRGRAKVLAWPRETPSGVRYHFSCCCLYPNKETGNLKEGRSFDLSDLSRLAHAVLDAEAWYRAQLREARMLSSGKEEAEPNPELEAEAA